MSESVSTRNENKPGYKKTMVGWIPEEWEVTNFRHACDTIIDGTHFSPQTQSGPYRYITSRNVRFGYLDLTVCQFISEKEHSAIYSRCPVKKGQVLLTKDGASTGNACVNSLDEPFSLLSSVAVLNGKNGLLENEYLLHWILSPHGHFLIKNEMAGQAITRLTLQTIGFIPISLPSIPEQKKIIDILSPWDETIEQTRKLINAKKRLKKALMQQMLTGKRRLPGFNEKWKEHHLGDLTSIIFSNVDKKKSSNEIPVYLCNYTDVYYNDQITRNMPMMKATATVGEINKYRLQKEDVLITKDSETAEDIAIPCYFADEVYDVICGYHLAIIRPTKGIVHGPFLSYLLMTDRIHYQFVRMANGVTRFGLPLKSVKRIKIRIPYIDEQQWIAKVLQCATAEMNKLELKLSALEKQKRGLMQKLLTGEVRVKT